MSASTVFSRQINPGWLRGPTFDTTLIVGVFLLAICAAFAITLHPALFGTLLVLDLWLLGYHHVMSTYTRLVFDRESFARHKHLATTLPAVVFTLTALVGYFGGVAVLATIYLHWQWFHYTRQSEGLARAYAGKSGKPELMKTTWNRLFFWLVPTAGIASVSARAPERFLGIDLHVLPVPLVLAEMLVALSLLATLVWLAIHLPRMIKGECSGAWFLFICTHQAMFFIAYILIHEINYGWLIINIWHNAQYIAFVWLFNTNRFHGTSDASAPFLSNISKPDNVLLYLAVCTALSTSMYLTVNLFTAALSISLLPLALICYQAINFHHYIVDAVIWKLRKPEIGRHLHLPARDNV